MKKVICIILCAAMIFSIRVNAYAEEDANLFALVEEEESNMDDVYGQEDLPCPYTLYIMGVHTTITDNEDGKIIMGVQVYCTEVMQEISTVYYLQQEISNSWVNVGSYTVTSEDVDHHVKALYVTNAPSGNYRVKTVNRVRDYNGFAESYTGYSPDMTYVNPDL